VLKRRLQDVARHRETVRSGRRDIPTVVLVGYTNAGKSSLLRALSGAATLVEDRLFATLDTLTREITLDGAAARRLRLIDTVGFIRKLPHHLVASFRATLDEARCADVLLHVIDASHPDWEEQVRVVNGVLAELLGTGPVVVHVFNKMDVVPEPRVFRARVSRDFANAVCISAATGDVAELTTWLDRCVGPGAAV
jgi:GTP-binding protein HflX